MKLLVDTHLQGQRVATFHFGMAVNAAMSENPKDALKRILNPPKEIRMEDLPPMLRIPKKHKKKESQDAI